MTVKKVVNATLIFLAGVGAEDDNGPRGNVRRHGDLVAQCEYAFDKIKRVFPARGANMNYVAISYLTDMKKTGSPTASAR